MKVVKRCGITPLLVTARNPWEAVRRTAPHSFVSSSLIALVSKGKPLGGREPPSGGHVGGWSARGQSGDPSVRPEFADNLGKHGDAIMAATPLAALIATIF